MLAISLAMDATAVAATRGLIAPRVRARDVLLVALLFGGFQALMPLLGWSLGMRVSVWVQGFGHWIVFALLCGLGLHMLHEARKPEVPVPGESGESRDVFKPRTLVMLAIATSIDAFAAGVALPLLGAPKLASIAIIGVTTALLCAVGVLVGRRFGAMLGRRLDALGGLTLIALGLVALVQGLR